MAASVDGAEAPHRRWGVSTSQVAWMAVLVLGVLFLVNASPWLAAPFGDSHDGRNVSVWGANARALRADPIGSHLGGVRASDGPYATHPPLIVAAAALTSAVTRDHPVGYRLPAVLASLATLAMLALVLVRMGFGAVAVVSGLVLAGTSGMFLTYGAMLDTPMLGLPLAAAVLWIVARVQADDAPVEWMVAVIGLLCGLTSWQAGLTAAIAGLLLVAVPSTRARSMRPVAILLGALAVGTALAVAWAWWAYGDLASVRDAFTDRTGVPDVWWLAQRTFVGDLFGPLRVGAVVVGMVVALVWRRHRLIMFITVATTVVWDLIFRQGATIHDYWTYFGVLPVAIGSAIVVAAVLAGARSTVPRLQPLVVGAVCLIVGATALVSLLKPSTAEKNVRSGIDGGRVAAAIPRATSDHQVVVYSISNNIPGGVAWAAWRAHGVAKVLSPAATVKLGRTHPDALVLIRLPGRFVPTDKAKAEAIAIRGQFLLMPASSFVDS